MALSSVEEPIVKKQRKQIGKTLKQKKKASLIKKAKMSKFKSEEELKSDSVQLDVSADLYHFLEPFFFLSFFLFKP